MSSGPIHIHIAAATPSKKAGYAYVIESDGERAIKAGSIDEAGITYPRLCLFAAILSLGSIKERSTVYLHSTNEYVTRGMTEWIDGWIANDWTKQSGEPVLNQDLWKELRALDAQHAIEWVHEETPTANCTKAFNAAQKAAKAVSKKPDVQLLEAAAKPIEPAPIVDATIAGRSPQEIKGIIEQFESLKEFVSMMGDDVPDEPPWLKTALDTDKWENAAA